MGYNINMKKIELSKGEYALVDDEDYEYLIQGTWHLSTKGYAIGRYKNKRVTMHRLVNQTPPELQTDHINRNKLDNRRINLRSVTASQNQHNTKIQSNNNSGYPGVSWKKYCSKWRAQIMVNRKNIQIGYFDNLHDAIKARQLKEKELSI
jgi:hypothetical protein